MDQPSFTPMRACVALLTDFGLEDGYVGVMNGVILHIAPQTHLIDLTHAIPPQDIDTAAWVLKTSYRYFAPATVFTCVVDPGVGSERHPIALHAGNWTFVGPDNGLFSWILAELPVHEVVTLSNPTYHLPQVSATFQGRDIFAPVSAHIAAGIPLSYLGPSIDPLHLQRRGPEPARLEDKQIFAHIIHIDHFGNLITSIPFTMVPDLFHSPGVQLQVPARDITVTERRRYFSAGPSDGATPFIYLDSSGYLAIALRNAHAANVLGIQRGDAITFVTVTL